MKNSTLELHPQFIVDEEGKPKSVVLDYNIYRELLEILEDLSYEEEIQKRLKEASEPFPMNADALDE